MTDVPTPQSTPERRYFPGGLRAQLLILLASISIITLATLALVMTQLTKAHMVKLSHNHAHDMATVALAEMIAMAPTTTFIDREERLKRLQKNGRLAFVGWRQGQQEVITTKKTALLHHYRSSILNDQLTTHTSTTIENEVYTWTQVSKNEHTLTLAIPVRDLQTSLNRVRDLSWIYLFINALLITVLGYAALTYLVLRPLKALNASTNRAAGGSLSSAVTLIPHNEFGELGRSFNVMLATLKDNSQSLEKQLQALERTNAQLQKTQDSLVRSEKLASIGQLAAGIAHEVGNPLAVIQGYAEILRDDILEMQPEDHDQIEMLKHIQSQVDRIQIIVRQLLDFSRDDTHQTPEVINLGNAIEEVISLANTTKRTNQVKLIYKGKTNHSLAMGVYSQLMQILLNMIFNACDAMSQANTVDPIITMEITTEGTTRCLHVKDNGPGIDPTHQYKIFEPFFTTKDPGSGTGLGLSVCLKLMQQIDGDIELVTSSEDGTHFCLIFKRPET